MKRCGFISVVSVVQNFGRKCGGMSEVQGKFLAVPLVVDKSVENNIDEAVNNNLSLIKSLPKVVTKFEQLALL